MKLAHDQHHRQKLIYTRQNDFHLIFRNQICTFKKKRLHLHVKDRWIITKFTLELAMKAQTGSRGTYTFSRPLTSAPQRGSSWSTPRPGHFNPGNDPVPIL
jgi:hypothetical protein